MSNYQKSSEYKYLISRVKIIKKNIIYPSMLNKIIYSKRDEDLCRSFYVLCHAELESYFESIAKGIRDKSKQLWNSRKISNFNLTSLLINTEKYKDTKASTDTKITYILHQYEDTIKNNNGIKSENLKKLFQPFGYDFGDSGNFDPAWLSTLDSFGSKRGNIAHNSAQIHIAFDIHSTIATINIILDGIEEFEKIIFST